MIIKKTKAKAFPWGKVPPQGADEGDLRGCIRYRRADTEVRPYKSHRNSP